MAALECKICGGSLMPIEGTTTAECDSCGRVQPIPAADDEKKIALFARANRLRAACEFDKAAGIYETLISDFPRESEAYWGLVLCKYGIEYVDDPAGGKVPTCHRSSFDSILDDTDYEQALENADVVARKLYREEAKQLEEIRKGIIAVSANEDPYDIFICYKETGFDNERTEDSVIAHEIYNKLTEQGYRVFFSRITLENKLGTAFEPYIFAALNSAKVMLAIGTDYEHFNAVWVKNEWSRFLKLMQKNSDKYLIPCFKGIDPEDMPKEFSRLQSLDLSKPGATLDLLHVIGKMAPKKTETVQVQERVVVQNAGGIQAGTLVKRGMLALTDGEWANAEKFFEEALNHDAECAEAYLGKYLTSLQMDSLDRLAAKKLSEFNGADAITNTINRDIQWQNKVIAENTIYDLRDTDIRTMLPNPGSYTSRVVGTQSIAKAHQAFLQDRLLQRAKSYAAGDAKTRIDNFFHALTDGGNKAIEDAKADEANKLSRAQTAYRSAKEAAEVSIKNANAAAAARQENHYLALCAKQEKASGRYEFEQLANAFAQMGSYKDAATRCNFCKEQLLKIDYTQLCAQQEKASSMPDFEKLVAGFEKLGSYKDAKERLAVCKKKLSELRAAAQAERARAEREALELKKKKEKKEKAIATAIVLTIVALIIGVIVFIVLLFTSIIPGNKYKKAEALFAQGKYTEAADAFLKRAKYKDSLDRAYACAEAMEQNDMVNYAAIYFGKLENHKDSHNRSMTLWSQITDRSHFEKSSGGNSVAIKEDGSLIISPDWLEKAYDTRDIASTPAGNIKNAVAVAFYNDEDIIVLLDDGTVDVLCDSEGIGCSVREKVEAWTGVVDIVAGEYSVFALKKDGTLVQTERYGNENRDVKKAKNIIDIVCGADRAELGGITADGTVWLLSDGFGQSMKDAVTSWTDVVELDLSTFFIVARRSDGTVLYYNGHYEDNVDLTGWSGIADIACDDDVIYALTQDGKLLSTRSSVQENAAGYTFAFIECAYNEPNSHRDIIAITTDGVAMSTDGNRFLTSMEEDNIWVNIKTDKN